MQALVEELETANEELQSTNEELQSSNEELQSTNEEMETSNEELQSTNEELETAYAELKEIYSTNKNIQEKNQQLLDQYQMLLESVRDSVTISTAQGLFVHANQAMTKLTGYTKDQLLLKSWDELAVIPNNKSLKQLYKALIQDGYCEPFELEILTKDSKTKTVIINSYLVDNKTDPVKIWTFAEDITKQKTAKQKTAKQKLDKLNKQYETTFSEASIGICNIGLDGKIFSINDKLCNILGYSKNQIINKPFNNFTYSEDVTKDKKELKQLHDKIINSYRVEKRLVTKNKETLWTSITKSCVRNDDEKSSYYIAVIEDINIMKLLSFEKNMAQMIMNTTQELIMVTDSNKIIEYVNPAFEKVLGYTKDELIGKHNVLFRSGNQPDTFYKEMNKALDITGKWSGEIINHKKNGDPIELLLNIDLVKDDKHQIEKYVAVYSNVSKIRQKDTQIRFLANHDSLTKLQNRSSFEQNFEVAIHNASADFTKIAIYFIDLDRFKIVNDGLGHDIGDLVLIKVAKRLNRCARKGDTVARIGGDEFAIFAPNLKDHSLAGHFANRIITEISKPMIINGHNIDIGASIGISIFPDDGNQSNELIKSADIAMYEAKKAGRHTYKYASSQLSNNAFEKATIDHAISNAITNKEFKVYYQPIISVETGEILHFESLIRWKHPTMGFIMPNKFISIAEESSIIEEVTLYVTNQVIDDLKVLQSNVSSDISLSINFSIRDFISSSLFDFIENRICQAKINPNSLIIEMTERKIISDRFTDKNCAERYSKLGCKIAIDDFGTGYSNLSVLNKMKIDFLKIDKSFIDGIGINTQNEEIIKATIAIAKALQYETIAEGVETKKQYDFLKRNGCNYIQGYYICEPKPIEEIMLFLKDRKSIDQG